MSQGRGSHIQVKRPRPHGKISSRSGLAAPSTAVLVYHGTVRTNQSPCLHWHPTGPWRCGPDPLPAGRQRRELCGGLRAPVSDARHARRRLLRRQQHGAHSCLPRSSLQRCLLVQCTLLGMRLPCNGVVSFKRCPLRARYLQNGHAGLRVLPNVLNSHPADLPLATLLTEHVGAVLPCKHGRVLRDGAHSNAHFMQYYLQMATWKD